MEKSAIIHNMNESYAYKIGEHQYLIRLRTKKDDFGNGLGLYITKEILNKHNLEINVENIENGVKFYIIFK